MRFTKERLEEIAEDGFLKHGESKELARMALAGMEAELERGKIRRFELDMSDCDSCGQDRGADMVEDLDGDYVLWDEVLPHLYQHAEYDKPQPLTTSERAELENYRNAQKVVRDELTREEYKRRFMQEDNFDDTFRGGWNAYRAAMLQGAEPVTTAYKLPEGWVMVPREATSEMINSAMRDNETGEVAEIYELMIAAAPKQEAE